MSDRATDSPPVIRRFASALEWARVLGECLGLMAIAVGLGFILYAQGKSRASEPERIRIVTGLVPPYMDELGRGREAEIIVAALSEAFRPEQIDFFVQPFTRHWSSFLSDDRYDAVTTVPNGLRISGYESEVYIHYQNGIGYRRAAFPDGFRGFSYESLSGRRVVAFGGAAQILSGLAAHTRSFALYADEKDQRIHSQLLIQGVVDAVIADGAILLEYNRRLDAGGVLNDITFAPVFCATPYRMVFRKAEHKTVFDAGIRRLEASGALKEIENRFLAENRLADYGYGIRDCAP